jgi:Cyclic nucleotide-binding domain
MPSIQDFLAKKDHGKALQLIRAEMARRPSDRRLRLYQADALILAGRDREAAAVLLGLADDHAKDGFAAKAIAVLKRIEKIDPGRRDVEQRLAGLIQEKVRSTPSAAARGSMPEIGLEAFDSSAEIGFGAPAAEPSPEPEASVEPEPITLSSEPMVFAAEPEVEPALGAEVELEPIVEADAGPEPSPAAATPAPPAPVQDDDLEALDYLAEDEPIDAVAAEPQPILSTPLFEGFSQEELVAVMHGMTLRTWAAGDVLMAEGAPGDSLYVLTTGLVKCWVKDAKGNYIMVQELPEGAFFGEISVLTGRPRTATLTAACECEALELHKKTLDGITAKHPRVRDVLKKFHEQRALDTVQAILKKRD